MDSIIACNHEILKKKCSKHPLFFCDMINIDQQATQHMLCTFCIREQNISMNNIIHLRSLLNMAPSTEIIIFQVDQNLTNLIESNSDLEEISNKIDTYFLTLKDKIEKLIYKKLLEEKEKIQNLINLKDQSSQSMKSLIQVRELQNCFLSLNNNIEDSLHQFILRHCSDSEKYLEQIKKIQPEIDAARRIFSSLGEYSHQIQSHLLFFIDSINLFDENKAIFTTPFSLVQKKWDQSKLLCFPLKSKEPTEQLNIIYLKNQVVITSKLFDARQCYLANEFNHYQKYIIRLQLNNQSPKIPKFGVGLIGMNTTQIASSQICYFEARGGNSSKVVKGTYLNSGEEIQQIGKKNLEIRIHISEKIWKVSQFPDYENVVELQNPSALNGNKKYHLGILIGNEEDSITILEILEVSDFDNKM